MLHDNTTYPYWAMLRLRKGDITLTPASPFLTGLVANATISK